ncbi:MAG: hypothetical protein Q8Q16_05770, partial [Betaproteobacteria bacterium]|nr:hypothetical protein [Betaproteobacteria bacterium]
MRFSHKIAERPLRAPRANPVVGADEKRIRTKNTVMDNPEDAFGVLIKIADCVRTGSSSAHNRRSARTGRRPRKSWRCSSKDPVSPAKDALGVLIILALPIRIGRAQPFVYAAQRPQVAITAGRLRIFRLHGGLAGGELRREPRENPAPFGDLRVPAEFGQGFLYRQQRLVRG